MTSPWTLTAHVRDLLGPLADEGDHQEDVGVVGADPVGDGLEQHRLARLGRAHDQRALALPDRVDQVDEALAQVLGVGLEVDQLDRVDRRQVPEVRAPAGGVGVDAVDAVDTDQAPELLALVRRADRPGDPVADAEAEAAHLARRDVHVIVARQQAMAAHEAVAVIDHVEDAERVVEARALGLGLQDLVDQVVTAVGGRVLDVELDADLTELVDGHLGQVADVQVVALARGFELRDLVLLRHGQAVGGLGASPGSAVAAGALVGAVGHWGEHT